MYTFVDNGTEVDRLERAFNSEFEQPGIEASEKLLQGLKLKREDWHAIIRLFGAQELRTPLSFIESMKRWETEIPDVLDRTMRDSLEAWTLAAKEGVRLSRPEPEERNAFQGLINVNVKRDAEGGAMLEASVTAGRRFWIASIEHLLNGRAIEELLRHEWSIVTPAGNEEWPITDQPTLRLNYMSDSDYNFDGGWGYKNSNLLMPLSPRHLLYAQVNKKERRYFTASQEVTKLIQRLLVERAFRWVYARDTAPWITKLRPRLVDAQVAAEEADAWARWHEEQSESETAAD